MSEIDNLRPSDYPFPQLYAKPEPACAAGEDERIASITNDVHEREFDYLSKEDIADAMRFWCAKFDTAYQDGRASNGDEVLKSVTLATDAVQKLSASERENAALRAALESIKHKATAIQSIRYGPDGDCGADRLANLIEEDAERALAGKAVGE